MTTARPPEPNRLSGAGTVRRIDGSARFATRRIGSGSRRRGLREIVTVTDRIGTGQRRGESGH
ncbi:hypothetical protein MFAL_02330 [Mycolicibacterium fallax]|nr:hypothetical protein MFAL_02330 [Mycolicibacterium fallax]